MSQFLLVAIILVVLYIAIFKGLLPYLHKRRILSYQFPQGWLKFIQMAFPHYQNFSSQDRRRLEQNIQVLVADTEFHEREQQDTEIEDRVILATQMALFNFKNSEPINFPKEIEIFLTPEKDLHALQRFISPRAQISWEVVNTKSKGLPSAIEGTNFLALAALYFETYGHRLKKPLNDRETFIVSTSQYFWKPQKLRDDNLQIYCEIDGIFNLKIL